MDMISISLISVATTYFIFLLPIFTNYLFILSFIERKSIFKFILI